MRNLDPPAKVAGYSRLPQMTPDSLSNASHRASLHPEEEILWSCARTWRSPNLPAASDRVNWGRAVEIAQSNRAQRLLHRVLWDTGLMEEVPPAACETLQQDVIKLTRDADRMSTALGEYLDRAAERGIETVVLKGLAVSINVYGDPVMRPGGDIDLLVRRGDVDASLGILDEMDIGQHWPNLLHDRYYEQHHLHLQRCTEDLRIWFEIHWALDHPYTLLTIDYDALMDRTTPGELLGHPVNELAPPDLLLSLAVHLVKHAIYLPSVIERPDLARIILADDMLMYFLDVAEVVKRLGPTMDWAFVVELAQASGAVEVLGSVFRVCREFLDAPVPAWVLRDLPVDGSGPVTQNAMHSMADYELATYLGEERSGLWDLLTITNGAFILRPIRILDTAAYVFPDGDYLRRRYGDASPLTAGKHFFRALAEYGRLGVDTVYYTWERYRRLKAMNYSTSLFNRLEVDEG